jgi:hypothetical protein
MRAWDNLAMPKVEMTAPPSIAPLDCSFERGMRRAVYMGSVRYDTLAGGKQYHCGALLGEVDMGFDAAEKLLIEAIEADAGRVKRAVPAHVKRFLQISRTDN